MATSSHVMRNLLLAFSVAVIVILTLAAVFAPYVNAELSPYISSHAIIACLKSFFYFIPNKDCWRHPTDCFSILSHSP